MINISGDDGILSLVQKRFCLSAESENHRIDQYHKGNFLIVLNGIYAFIFQKMFFRQDLAFISFSTQATMIGNISIDKVRIELQ